MAATLLGCGGGNRDKESVESGRTSETSVTATEQAVIVHLKSTTLNLQSGNLEHLFALEDQLRRVIDRAGVGEYDGNEVAVDGSEAILYAYGPDADALWDVMQPHIERIHPLAGSYVIKRYGGAGDPAAREVRLDLG
jgi:hypothetical protein